MQETLREPFIRTARALGVGEGRLLLRHALPHAMLPVTTMIALSFGSLFSGALVVETTFAYLGVGKLIFDAILGSDFNLALLALMLATLVTLLSNLAADLAYAWLDPRISYAERVTEEAASVEIRLAFHLLDLGRSLQPAVLGLLGLGLELGQALLQRADLGAVAVAGGVGEARFQLGALLVEALDRRARLPSPAGAGAPAASGARRRGGGRPGGARRGGLGGRLQQQPAIVVHVAVVGADPAVGDQPQGIGDQLDQMAVVADDDDRTRELVDRLDQGLAAVDVEMVGGLVEDQELRRVEAHQRQGEPGLLAAREVAGLGARPGPGRGRSGRARRGSAARARSGRRDLDVLERGLAPARGPRSGAGRRSRP